MERGGMNEHHNAHFHITAESDPQVHLRVLGLFAQRYIIPSESRMTSNEGSMRVEIWQPGLGTSVAQIVAEKLRSIPLVRSVELRLVESSPC
jgi:hypothetical protein